MRNENNEKQEEFLRTHTKREVTSHTSPIKATNLAILCIVYVRKKDFLRFNIS